MTRYLTSDKVRYEGKEWKVTGTTHPGDGFLILQRKALSMFTVTRQVDISKLDISVNVRRINE